MRTPLLVRPMAAAAAVVFGVVVGCACRAPPPCSGSECQAACPRDAVVDASGRCACVRGDLPVLGACVPPPVADAYCGRAARASPEGCAFVACGPEQAVDVDVGCAPIASLAHSGGGGCPAGAALVVASGRTACVPADAACPRGSAASNGSCVRPARCPPGTLGAGGTCRPIVVRRHDGAPVVDLGAWAALVLGLDGGPGTAELCRPLQAHPTAFGLDRGETLSVDVTVGLTVPDEDLTRIHADVHAASTQRPVAAAASGVAEAAVATLLEPLRGLGAESSATRVLARVQCSITSL